MRAPLLDRLRSRKTEHRITQLFGGAVYIPDETVTRKVLINPDGPEAADEITRLNAEVERLTDLLGASGDEAKEAIESAGYIPTMGVRMCIGDLLARTEAAEANAARLNALIDEMVKGLEDVRTHRQAWRNALVLAFGRAEVKAPDIDDKAYWRHEIEVFDRTFDALILKARGKDANVG